MRDLAMMLMFLPLVGLALRSAFAAYLLWAWASLFGPQAFMYGTMRGVSYVQWFALITLAMVLAKRDPQFNPRPSLDALGLCMLLFTFHAIVVAVLAYPGLARNVEISSNVVKIMLCCLLMPLVVTTRTRVNVMMMMMALALGTHGFIEGLKFVASGGSHLSQGNARMGDRNHFALFMVMALPLMVYLYSQFQHRLVRITMGFVIAVVVLSIVSSQSRGGLVALMGVGLWFVLRSQRKLAGLSAVLLGVALVLSVAPERWFERMETIQTAEGDSSFMGRVQAWKRATAIAVEHPIFGGGFHSVQAPSIFDKYRYRDGLMGFIDAGDPIKPRAAHSIYFETLGDMGFPGLILFLLIMFSVFVTAGRVRRQVKKIGPSIQWAAQLTTMVSVSMVAYLVGGGAVSMAYVDLPYLMAMLVAVTYRLVMQGDQAAALR